MQPLALVVDDEPLVLTLVSAILTARGWRVLRAEDAAEALARAHGVDLDLLITDLNLPDIDGGTLARRLCETDPDLPVLVISGEPRATMPVQGIRHDFLAKPFSIRDLALRVESLTGYAAGSIDGAQRG